MSDDFKESITSPSGSNDISPDVISRHVAETDPFSPLNFFELHMPVVEDLSESMEELKVTAFMDKIKAIADAVTGGTSDVSKLTTELPSNEVTLNKPFSKMGTCPDLTHIDGSDSLRGVDDEATAFLSGVNPFVNRSTVDLPIVFAPYMPLYVRHNPVHDLFHFQPVVLAYSFKNFKDLDPKDYGYPKFPDVEIKIEIFVENGFLYYRTLNNNNLPKLAKGQALSITAQDCYDLVTFCYPRLHEHFNKPMKSYKWDAVWELIKSTENKVGNCFLGSDLGALYNILK